MKYKNIKVFVFFISNSKEFTITAWVRVFEKIKYANLLNFGNGNELDNVVLALNNDLSPVLIIFNDKIKIIEVISDINLNLSEWYHLAAVFDRQFGRIYVNGQQTASFQLKSRVSIRKVIRNECFIGESSSSDQNSANKLNLYLDELAIYNVALDKYEILLLASESNQSYAK